MAWLSDPGIWAGFLTLTALEIVLGIDNIVFISILASRLPAGQQPLARRLGLLAALGSRLALLASISFIIRLTEPLFTLLGSEVSGRDLVLIAGGLFLLVKSTREIHAEAEGEPEGAPSKASPSFAGVIAQIMVLDLVFSLDSVITAVGMVEELGVMVAAVVVAVAFMMVFSTKISDFVHRHATLKMLALSFLLMIGIMLVLEGFDHHVPRGYVYFAMAFAVFVEMLNLRVRGRAGRARPARPERKRRNRNVAA